MKEAGSLQHSGIYQARDIVTEQDLLDAGINLASDFPAHAIEDLRKYPVLSEGGWFIVIKNQKTLESLSRKPWRLLGPIKLLSEDLDLN